MATWTRKPEASSKTLADELARVLPKGVKFTAHHLSTPPTVTEPLCYPPAYLQTNNGNSPSQDALRARKPLRTYCEKHFLAFSVAAPETREQVLVLALEIYIYTTAHSSIIFVAKADSTGYLGVANLPEGTPSPIREVTTAFISYLVANRKRKDTQFVVNLFARSQSQYLFPGSVKNSGKHILDDRGLLKWWCRVLNPLLEASEAEKWDSIHGYLIIPGLDEYETRAFLPRTASSSKTWTLGHPLERISPYISDPVIYGSSIPTRCLIPTYPDDPKARFVQELEDSTSEKTKLLGGWKSPRTLDLFWEMMAHRTECSSGRMTGFIWVVFDPHLTRRHNSLSQRTARSLAAFVQTPEPSSSAPEDANSASRLITPEPGRAELESRAICTNAIKAKTKQSRRKRILKGRIVPRQPRVKTGRRAHFPKEIETAYYYWPEEGRGQVVLDEPDYNRAVELLLHLEFSTLQHTITSSTRWTKEVNYGNDWGLQIVGQREATAQSIASGADGINNISSMVKKKRPASDAAADVARPASESSTVNTLGSGLVRKKVKTVIDNSPAVANTEMPIVHTLSAGSMRTKPKAN